MKLMKFFIISLVFILFIGCTKKTIKENEEVVNNDMSLEESFINSTLYVIPSRGLNLRDEPSLMGSRIALLPHNTELTVLDKSEKKETIDELHDYWYKIETEEKIGWVFGGYLAKYPVVIINNGKQVPKFIYDLEIKFFPNAVIFYAEEAIEYYNKDRLTIFENNNKESEYFTTDYKNLYLYKVTETPDWLYVITDKAEALGYIYITDISLESYYGNIIDKNNKEYEIIKRNNNISRYGPLLIINHNNNIVFWNTFNGIKGGIYHLLNYYPDNDEILMIEQYYEDSNVFIYNLNEEKIKCENLAFYHLYFNDSRTYLFSLHWGYGGPTFPYVKIYHIDKNNYKLIYDDTIYGLYSGEIINKISWVNDHEIKVDCSTGITQVIVDKEEVKVINNLKYDDDRFEH